jgi:IS1 family transposase
MIAATDGSTGKVSHKISKLIQAYRSGQCYTDFWKSYETVIRRASNTQRSAKKQEKPRVLECWYNTLRRCLARFVRKTLAFSQSLFMHNACLNHFSHSLQS